MFLRNKQKIKLDVVCPYLDKNLVENFNQPGLRSSSSDESLFKCVLRTILLRTGFDQRSQKLQSISTRGHSCLVSI